MKKSKLKLKDLKLKSFVTDLKGKTDKNIKGGHTLPHICNGDLTGPNICTYPESERLCESDVICYDTNLPGCTQ